MAHLRLWHPHQPRLHRELLGLLLVQTQSLLSSKRKRLTSKRGQIFFGMCLLPSHLLDGFCLRGPRGTKTLQIAVYSGKIAGLRLAWVLRWSWLVTTLGWAWDDSGPGLGFVWGGPGVGFGLGLWWAQRCSSWGTANAKRAKRPKQRDNSVDQISQRCFFSKASKESRVRPNRDLGIKIGWPFRSVLESQLPGCPRSP